MPRTRQIPPGSKGRSKELLFNAETAVTSTDDSVDDRKQRVKKQKGEKVEAPSPELLRQPTRDWGKIGVYVALAIAAIGLIYNYADLAALTKNTAEDVKELKRKSEDLLRSSIETSARIGVLERRDTAPKQSPSASSPINALPR